MNTATYERNEQLYANRCVEDDIRVRAVLPLVGRCNRVLDVGCFDGRIGVELQKAGNVVHGIDASLTAVNRAVAAGIDAYHGSVEDPLPFPDNTFNAVLAAEIIEHVYDIDMVFSEMRRVLRPGGHLVVTTPNLASLGRRLMLVVNRNPLIEISFTGDAAGHIRYFVKHTLLELLDRYSFVPQVFTSDVVNFNRSGSVRSTWLAKAVPTLGRSLIVKAVVAKEKI